MCRRREKATKMATRNPIKLKAPYVEALQEFSDAPTIQGLYPDSVVSGLFLYVGPRSTVWRFRQRRTTRDKSGRRPTVAKALGTFPAVGIVEARKAALALANDVAHDKAPPSKRTAATFEIAWTAYLEHLLRKANEKGKPARHHANATKLGDNLILPTWAKWTLTDMAQSPGAVEEWHAKMSRVHGPVSANRAAELIRAAYKYRAKRDVTLSLDRLPTSSVIWNKEEPSQHAIGTPKDFKAWRKAWDAVPSPVHRGYHLFCLLTGCRPGEAARIKLENIDLVGRMFTIPNAKAGKDITLPMTREIAAAIAMAVDAPPQKILMKGLRGMKRGERKLVDRKQPHHEIIDKDLVFPGCRQMPSRSGLPIAGQGLRHTFKTLHAELGISETLSHFLMGHALEGVSAKYIAELLIVHGPALREAQENISRRVFELLGLAV
jgi:integrase